jgi:predicted O-methyltransferase YrrM
MNNRRHTAVIETHPDVMMDDCHIDLIAALVGAHKPERILEIGIGTGALTVALLKAIEDNGVGELTCVDNFGDWSEFKEPPGFSQLKGRMTQFFNYKEEDFVDIHCRKYGLVISDADHARTGEWVEKTMRLVKPGGFLVYHDSTSPHCPSVKKAVDWCLRSGYQVMTFNRSSQPWERCERGLSIIKKP